MQKRKIRFALVLNDTPVRNIDDLRANFDGLKMLEYYNTDDLQKWLEQRHYHDVFQQLQDIKATTPTEKLVALHQVFEIPLENESVRDLEENIKRQNKVNRIKEFTKDERVLEDISLVVFNQTELEERLSQFEPDNTALRRVYLIGDIFHVSDCISNMEYIGITNPKVYLDAQNLFDGKGHHISFKNVNLTANEPMQLRLENTAFVHIDEQMLQLGLDPLDLELKKKINVYDDVQRIHYYKDDWILIVTNKRFSDFDREEKFREFYLYNLKSGEKVELDYPGEYITKNEFIQQNFFVYCRNSRLFVIDLEKNKLVVSFSTTGGNHRRNSMYDSDYIFIEDKIIYVVKGVVISDNYYYGQLNCYDMNGNLLNYNSEASEKPLNTPYYQKYKDLASKIAELKAKWKMGRFKFNQNRIIAIGMSSVYANDYGFTTKTESDSRKIYVFDYKDLKIEKTFTTKNPIFDIEFCDKYILAIDSERQLTVIDAENLKVIKTKKLSEAYFGQLHYYNNILFTHGDNYIHLFE